MKTKLLVFALLFSFMPITQSFAVIPPGQQGKYQIGVKNWDQKYIIEIDIKYELWNYGTQNFKITLKPGESFSGEITCGGPKDWSMTTVWKYDSKVYSFSANHDAFEARNYQIKALTNESDWLVVERTHTSNSYILNFGTMPWI